MEDRAYLKVECHFSKDMTSKIFKLFELTGSSGTALVEIPEGIIIRNIDREIKKAQRRVKRI